MRVEIIGDATIYCGDVLEVLGGFPDESVHCVVTSPPYWGLRDYCIEPQVWDARPGCEHKWGPLMRRHKGGPPGGGQLQGRDQSARETVKDIPSGSFCQLCDAWLGSLGLEPTPELFVKHIVSVFNEVRRILRKDGTCWVNLGDSYATGTTSERKQTATGKHGYWENPAINKRINGKESGLKPKDLIGIPWRVAFALQAAGWWLRQDIIWSKPNPMPESVRDRCTKAHEYVFLFTKSARYYFDAEAIKEQAECGEGGGASSWRGDRVVPRESRKRGEFNGKTNTLEGREAFRAIREMRNKRDVWEIATQPFPAAHFATYPEKLIEPCILAGCPPGGTVLDPFHGSGTTGVVALNHCRKYIGIELNPEYIDISLPRIREAWKHQPRLFKEDAI